MAKKIDRKLNGEDIIEKEFGDFLENGGEIGGTILHNKNYSGNRYNLTNGSGWWDYIHPEHGRYVLASNTSGIDREEYHFHKDCFLPVGGQKSLGEEYTRWKDIWLDGFSKSTNGYTKLPNGLILQWGSIATPTEGGYEIAFPIIFPNSVFRVLTSVDSTAFHNVRTYNASTSRFNLATTGGNMDTSVNWMAIGY